MLLRRLTLLCIAAASCESGDKLPVTTLPETSAVVEYALTTGGVTCVGADVWDLGTIARRCTWYCVANHDGMTQRTVELAFANPDGSGWRLTAEQTSPGQCQRVLGAVDLVSGPVASYSLTDDGATCPGASITDVTYYSAAEQERYCTWSCASYGGRGRGSVVLSFEKPGQDRPWNLVREIFNDGHCW